MVLKGRSTFVLGAGEALGTFSVPIGIKDASGERSVELDALVDTGSTFTQIPGHILRQLGHQSVAAVRLRLADGRSAERQLAELRIEIDGEIRTTQCLFGDDDGPILLGMITLEQFLLAVDPINHRLVPVEGMFMAQHGKKYMTALEKIDDSRMYEPNEALGLLKEITYTKFDETVELHIRTGLDTRHAEQQLRGTLVLPHGLGKTQRVLVFAEGEGARLAEQSGADFVGSDDMIKKVEGGWLDFEVALATKELMGKVGRLGRVLGPRGLMPNPRTNTVVEAEDLPRAIRDSKQGRVEFRTDRTNLVHVPLGKISFEQTALHDNLTALIDAVVRGKPSGAKGQYIRSLTLTTTMGPGIKLDIAATLSLSGAAVV